MWLTSSALCAVRYASQISGYGTDAIKEVVLILLLIFFHIHKNIMHRRRIRGTPVLWTTMSFCISSTFFRRKFLLRLFLNCPPVFATCCVCHTWLWCNDTSAWPIFINRAAGKPWKYQELGFSLTHRAVLSEIKAEPMTVGPFHRRYFNLSWWRKAPVLLITLTMALFC